MVSLWHISGAKLREENPVRVLSMEAANSSNTSINTRSATAHHSACKRCRLPASWPLLKRRSTVYIWCDQVIYREQCYICATLPSKIWADRGSVCQVPRHPPLFRSDYFHQVRISCRDTANGAFLYCTDISNIQTKLY